MKNIFVNKEEERPRAGWRILLQLILFILFLSGMQLANHLLIDQRLEIYDALAMGIAGIASVWVAAIVIDRRNFSAYGLAWNTRWKKEIWLGIGLGALAMSIIFVIEWAAGWLIISSTGWEQSLNIPYALLLANYLAAMVIIGFYEELIFRGYQILNMVEGFQTSPENLFRPALLALLISSLLFGAGHAFNPNASLISTFNVFLAGGMMAVPYLLTGRLAISVGLHISWNFVQGGVFGFPVSGLNFRGSLFQTRQQGPDLFTGGAFGPEAGLLGLFGMILVVGLYLLYLHKTNNVNKIDPSFRLNTAKSYKTDEQG